ncbi:MAG: hypothetical protein AAF985_18775 [Bacteroidota bacterium]
MTIDVDLAFHSLSCSAIGKIVGGIASLFKDNDCDCGPATGVSVSIINDSGDPCDPTYRLYATGAGNDADRFNDFNQTLSGTIEVPQNQGAVLIRPSSTNGGTLRNTFSIQFQPGSLGAYTTTGEDEFLLFISGSVGTAGTFRVRGTNNCSGPSPIYF